MKFKATTVWLKSVLPEQYASQIQGHWCWEEIGRWYRKTDIPDEIVGPIVQALIDSGNGCICYEYCRHVEDRPEVRQALIDSGNGYACYLYCRFVEDREDVRQALIDSGDGYACYCYCYYNVKDRDDVRQALIDSGDGNACYWYCLDVEDRPEVRAVAEGAA